MGLQPTSDVRCVLCVLCTVMQTCGGFQSARRIVTWSNLIVRLTHFEPPKPTCRQLGGIPKLSQLGLGPGFDTSFCELHDVGFRRSSGQVHLLVFCTQDSGHILVSLSYIS